MVTGCYSGVGKLAAIGLPKTAAAMAGLGSIDLVFETALAMAKGISARELAELIYPCPPLSEAVMNAPGKVEGEATFRFK